MATCAQPLPVTVTGTLAERMKGSAKTRTYPLARRHITLAGTGKLDVRLPRQAVSALKRGASETAAVILTYRTIMGQERVRVSHLTTSPSA